MHSVTACSPAGSRSHACVLVCCSVERVGLICDLYIYCRYGTPQVRYAVCSIIMQRVVGMTHVSNEDQKDAHGYAQQMLKREEQKEG